MHGARMLDHGVRETVELIDRLTFGAQGHEEPRDDRIGHFTVHDGVHGPVGLVPGEILTTRK